MKKIFALILGNLKEHLSKTIIMCLLITLGVFLIITGNSFLQGVTSGMETDFRSNYTGDIFIHGKPADKVIVTLSGALTNMGMPTKTPAIINKDSIDKMLNQMNDVKDIAYAISFMAQLIPENLSENFIPDDTQTMNVPYFYGFAGDENYYQNFADYEIIEGKNLEDKNSVIIDVRLAKKVELYYKHKVVVGENILLADMLNSDVKSVKVSGIYRCKNEGTVMLPFLYSDENTARYFAGLTYGMIQKTEEEKIFTNDDFSDEDIFSEDMIEVDNALLAKNKTNYDTILGDTTQRDLLNSTVEGSWSFILIHLKNSSRDIKTIQMINKIFTENGFEEKAIDWKKAAGSFISSAGMVSILLIAFGVILAVVVLIIIMNTLTISIIQRTSEIGTMRSLGASRKFIKQLFLGETFCIAFVSAICGMILSLIVTSIINSIGITVTGDTAILLLGGSIIHLIPKVSSIITTIIVIVILSLCANIYPLKIALRISPLDAMNNK